MKSLDDLEKKINSELTTKINNTEKYGVTHPTKPGLKIPQMFEAAINKELKGLWIIGEDIVQTEDRKSVV